MGERPLAASEPWRVRVCDIRGPALGSGTMLAAGHVLTCARILPGPDAPVVIEFPDTPPDAPAALARVAAEVRGEVVLLRLDRERPGGTFASLRRVPLGAGTAVRVGRVHGRLGAACGPNGEGLRLVVEGFGEPSLSPGAAVVEEETGHVVGVLVGVNPAWMLPVEAVVRQLPAAARWVGGDPATDASFVRRFDPRVGDLDFARRIAAWCRRPGGAGVTVVVTGEADSPLSSVVRRAVVLADRELRPPDEVVSRALADTVPPTGSVDLAMDAAGLTVSEATRRIVGRLGVPLDESAKPSGWLRATRSRLRLVVAGVDEAERPEDLVRLTLWPLARRGSRLLLGFRSVSSPSLRLTLDLIGELAGERLDRLAAEIGTVEAAELAARRRHEHVAARVVVARVAPAVVLPLRLRLAALRALNSGAGRMGVLAEIDAAERAAEDALAVLADATGHLDGLSVRREELRGRLASYKVMAGGHGLGEDIELGRRYRAAHEVLWRERCDLDVAATLVQRFQDAVHRRIGEAS
ncbi:hypothetical protein F0L68_32010 [Solihabitans fulvus]|uniref:Uncharacterized protein n=1 Tax=Solihabitans fulvus TaxID=1892852 RepID=A0A5B2WVH0_9PSEU|nr:hypothetical protein [Solihabitans fulvus]KAA2253897.1 hypothetical protein F0L68_32010 [Solihabitans fulvus]